MTCDHSGTQSGVARYLHQVGQLRLVLVCDRCGAECAELERIDYRPEARFAPTPPPNGSAPATRASDGRLE
jgi:hypothetical protein